MNKVECIKILSKFWGYPETITETELESVIEFIKVIPDIKLDKDIKEALEEERNAIKEIVKKLDNTLTSYIIDNVMLENQQLVLSKNNTLTLQRKIKQIEEVLKDE
jgi:hypothetical protein